MNPTVKDRDILIYERISLYRGDLERGDMVVFYNSEARKKVLKRVIGISGDTINIKDGKVYLNGKELEEAYLSDGVETDRQLGSTSRKWSIPEGYIFVMGDNRNASTDSRDFGYISNKYLRGRILGRIYPFNKIRLF